MFVFAGLILIVAFADLLLNLLADDINRRIEIAIHRFGKQVRPRHHQADGTGELALGGFGFVVIENDPGLNRKAIQMLEFRDPAHDVVFDGLGQRQVMRRKDQVHQLQDAGGMK